MPASRAASRHGWCRPSSRGASSAVVPAATTVPDTGAPEADQAPRQRAPRRHRKRRDRMRMTPRQRRRRRAVVESLADPRRRRSASCGVGHGDARLVADRPTRLAEPPHEVDVFAEAQRLVEPTRLVERRAPHDQRRGRNERHFAARADDGFVGAAIERRRGLFVTSERRGRLGGTVVMMRGATAATVRVVEVRRAGPRSNRADGRQSASTNATRSVDA